MKAENFKLSALGNKTHTDALHFNLNLYGDQILPKLKPHALEIPGQPFDRFYLTSSKLFTHSRKEFLNGKGVFSPFFISSERSLSSSGLLGNEIEYTPHEKELFFRAKEKDTGIGAFTRFSVSTFHEQNHRIFWKSLPVPTSLNEETLRRYLNLMESLVVALDMALGDELGTKNSAPGYQLGVLYDPGTEISFGTRRERLNYYHCAVHATFLNLEGYAKKNILGFLADRYQHLAKPLRDRAIERSLVLDRLFVEKTNPLWQKKHKKELLRFFSAYAPARKILKLSEDPGEFTSEYLLTEEVLGLFLKVL